MGHFIAIEGTDGSGKHTQTMLLCNALSRHYPIAQLSFPNYASPSSAPVQMYLHGELGTDPTSINAYAASSFYAVDRFISYKKGWEDIYLRDDTIIVSDRYTPSNAIHQAPKLPYEERRAYLDWLWDFEYRKLGIPKPDLVFYLDMPSEVSATLCKQRAENTNAHMDIHEADAEYLRHCREVALDIARDNSWVVIPCANEGKPLPAEYINRQMTRVVECLLDKN